MTKKKWNELDDEVKKAVLEIAEEKNCSIDEAYQQALLIGGAALLLGLAMNM